MRDGISSVRPRNPYGAYAQAQATRGPKAQEAEVFRRVLASLKATRDQQNSVAQRRALADARRLWGAVYDCVLHSDNQYPEKLRGSLASVALAVLREVDSEKPDTAFLISVTENIADGLDPEGASTPPNP